jgi:excisionase family DNA binding protein
MIDTSPENDRYMSVDEAARYLSISQQTLMRYIHTGQLPVHRIGARLLRLAQRDRRLGAVAGGLSL